jgi:hypothetical protein
MRRSLFCALLAVLALSAAPAAQDDKKTNPDDKKANKANSSARTAEVRFADGSFVHVTLLSENLEISTAYGKLSVPFGEIRRIEFGHRLPDDVVKRLEAAAAKLGSDEFKDREWASKELESLKELAYPTLQRLARSEDKEIAHRATQLLQALREKVPEEKLQFKTHDTIVTSRFTIVGRLDGNPLKARSPYFGDFQLKLADLRGLRPTNGEATEMAYKVDAAKFAATTVAWMETEVELSPETLLEVRTSGQIDMYPIAGSTGSYMSGPNGMRAWGVVAGETSPAGMLLGRVGTNGKVFEIGEKYEGATGQSGRLYLRIVKSPWNNASTGEYKVNISTR